MIKEYTVNVGDYDLDRADMLCIKDIHLFNDNARNSRMPKILSHKFVETDISVYWDANMFIKPRIDIRRFVKDNIAGYDMIAQISDAKKDCIYQEIEEAKNRVKTYYEVDKLTEQAEHYKSIGIPEHIGTLAGYQPLIRRHNAIVKAFNEAWWAEICRFSYRDQCSFPVILRQFPELKVNWVDLGSIRIKKYRHSNIKYKQ